MRCICEKWCATVIKSTGLATTTSPSYLTGVTLASGGAATVDFTKATIGGTKVSVSGTFTPEGTLSGTQAMGHTHSITLTDTTASGSASVSVANHTHSLNNHTHGITL